MKCYDYSINRAKFFQRMTVSLTKEKVNTTIISLRPCVAQAKVHIIHSLSRQIKNLRSKNCSKEKQKEQNERKAVRYVEEIDILKKSSKDSISRYILMTKRSFNDVLKKESKTQKFDMKVRSFARVSEHQAVKKIINQFRKDHPDWEKSLQRILATLGKKKKKKPSEDDDENKESDVEEEESENEMEDSDEDKEMEEQDEEDSESEGEQTFVNSLKDALKSNKEKVIAKDSRTSEGIVKMLDLNNISSNEDVFGGERPEEINGAKEDVKRSSFFLGGQSDSEDDSQDVEEMDDEEDDIEQRIEKYKSQGFESEQPSTKPAQNSNYRKHEKNFGRKKQFKNDILERSSQSNKTVASRDKRTSFQSQNKMKAPQTRNKPSEPVNNCQSSKEKGVHPSWEAKQKQKSSITAFQGKKTVFE